MKSLIALLMLIASCNGPIEEENTTNENIYTIKLAGKNDFLDKTLSSQNNQNENMLYREKFSSFNVLKENLIVNSKKYLNNKFSFYIPIKNENVFKSFEIKVFTEEKSNIFTIQNIENENITFIEFNKENIWFDLLQGVYTLEIEIIGFDKIDKASESSFYTIKFIPEYEETLELIIKGTYHYPGSCAGDLCFKPYKEKYNVFQNVNLSKAKIPFSKFFDLNVIPSLNQNLPPYYKNKFKYFKFDEVTIIPNSITSYLKSNLNKDKKILQIEPINN